jgi:hypothetical protein
MNIQKQIAITQIQEIETNFLPLGNCPQELIFNLSICGFF